MSNPRSRSKKTIVQTTLNKMANNSEKRSALDKNTDSDSSHRSEKTREQSRLNFSDEVKSSLDVKGISTQQGRDDQADWNLQSAGFKYSTRGKNQDYDYDEDDQEDENQFIEQGLIAAEQDRDFDEEVEGPNRNRALENVLDQYASHDLKQDLKK